MGSHDEYGKTLLREVAGSELEIYGPTVEVDYEAGQPARIDGTIAGRIAVEIESRTSKQVRGAVLDLLTHRYVKKLLVLLPVHMSNPEITAEQCRFALRQHIKQSDFQVTVLSGHGTDPKIKEDTKRLSAALRKLGYGNRYGER